MKAPNFWYAMVIVLLAESPPLPDDPQAAVAVRTNADSPATTTLCRICTPRMGDSDRESRFRPEDPLSIVSVNVLRKRNQIACGRARDNVRSFSEQACRIVGRPCMMSHGWQE